MAKPINNQSLLALGTLGLSPTWSGRIPAPATTYWEEQKLVWGADTYMQARNEVFDTLVNRIATTIVHNLRTIDPLSVFHNMEGLNYGDVIQELATDVVTGEQFQGVHSPQDQFEPSLNKVQAAYHKINREFVYRTTLGDTRIRRAFVDVTGLDRLLAEFVQSLYASDRVDEYLYYKRCFTDNLTGNAGVLLNSEQIIEIPDIRDPSTTPEETRQAILIMKNAVSQMCQNSAVFNQMGRTIASSRPDLVSVFDFRAKNQNETQNLATLYNPNMSILALPEIEVDNFGDGGTDIIGVVCEKEFVQSRDNLRTITTAQQARNLYVNYFYHVQQIYLTSPFKQALFFVPTGTKAKYAGKTLPQSALIRPTGEKIA